jgi:hypothetical protein
MSRALVGVGERRNSAEKLDKVEVMQPSLAAHHTITYSLEICWILAVKNRGSTFQRGRDPGDMTSDSAVFTPLKRVS